MLYVHERISVSVCKSASFVLNGWSHCSDGGHLSNHVARRVPPTSFHFCPRTTAPFLLSRCVRSKDCPSDPDLGRGIWVQQPALCPSITGINPSTIYVPSELQVRAKRRRHLLPSSFHLISSSQMPRIITLSISNVPNLTYSCVYSYSTVAIVTMGTTLSNNSITCATPNLSSISIPPSQGVCLCASVI